MIKSIKKFIKENYIELLLIACVAFLCYYPIDYEIETDGGLIKASDSIMVSPSNEQSGSINLTYVGGMKGTPFSLFLSWILPSWDAIKIETNSPNDFYSYDNELIRGKISLEQGSQNAKYVALKSANYEAEISSYNMAVLYITEDAITDLEKGDIITKIDGEDVISFENLSNILEQKNANETVYFDVKRGENMKEVKASATVREKDDVLSIGLYLQPLVEIKYDERVKIEFKNDKNAYGGSGGLMNTLYIYNQLTEFDITKGKKLSGTGTIELDGSVGEIGGVEHKLRGAYKKGADIFLVPSANYEEAIKVKEKYKMKIDIIEAKTFDDVIEILKNK